MFFIAHATASAALASVIKDPRIVLPLVFGGHFFLDKIPHWPAKKARAKLSQKLYAIVVFDVFVTVIILLWLSNISNNYLILWAALVGSIMDIDVIFYHRKFITIFNTPLPKSLSRLHGNSQNETDSVWGIVVQLAIVVLSIYLALTYA